MPTVNIKPRPRITFTIRQGKDKITSSGILLADNWTAERIELQQMPGDLWRKHMSGPIIAVLTVQIDAPRKKRVSAKRSKDK